MNYIYQNRVIQVPSGYSVDDIYTGSFTDSQIDNMWTIFLSCYANMLYGCYTEELKKGCEANIGCKLKYLVMALYCLRHWYNPINVLPTVNFFIITGISINVYLVSGDGNASQNFLLCTVSGATPQQQLASVRATLPVGFTAVLESDNSITITGPKNLSSWIYFVLGGEPNYIQFQGGFTLNPCPSQETIYSIIQNCIEICGSINCKSTLSLFNDINFVSLPIAWSYINNEIPTNPTSISNKYLLQ